MRNIGMYIHIPFCKQKCSYCDFISYCKKENLIQEYVECLMIEIRDVGDSFKANADIAIDTIYIGGGTPSYIDSIYISQILDTIYKEYNVYKDCEITIEINPGTITKEKLLNYKKTGINRISIGMQSSNNSLLKVIGRIHSYEEFLQCFRFSREARI